MTSRLDAMRARHDAGGYPDDRLPHLDLRRLTYARWLVSHRRIGETL